MSNPNYLHGREEWFVLLRFGSSMGASYRGRDKSAVVSWAKRHLIRDTKGLYELPKTLPVYIYRVNAGDRLSWTESEVYNETTHQAIYPEKAYRVRMSTHKDLI